MVKKKKNKQVNRANPSEGSRTGSAAGVRFGVT
jgi:hypothetical protein